ncbi:MAG: sulfoxide reductase heme-binding subunit YedZ [Anaerolineae bacterium]|nr:sulfoxide reductase heme-binding subunit YedZ [Anaerolineales bacterium]MCQ3972302.1 sulfoxide reductase heme-binding subunit YedZ [Anaerolineae bacterium]
MNTLRKNWLRILTHVGAVTPLAWLLWDYWFDNLTVNPIQDITFRTGKPALILLVLSLACTPVNTLFGFKQALPLRKPLGLYAFMYVSLHFLIFIGLDYGFDWGLLYEAIFEKRYALVGFAAFLILLPLAVTSTQGWMRRLGKNWKRLHRWVYLAGILAVIHYVWLVKSDIREPLLYGAAVALLLILRLPAVRKAVTNFRSRFKKGRRTRTVVDSI